MSTNNDSKSSSIIYKSLNNKISKMIVDEACCQSYLSYVHLYAHMHLYDYYVFRRLYIVVSILYPLDEVLATRKLNPNIEFFYKEFERNISCL